MPASIISFTPNPLVIQPESSGSVLIKIAVPSTAKTGSYSCFIQGKDMDNLKATLVVNIVK